jgi:hypothetical protein
MPFRTLLQSQSDQPALPEPGKAEELPVPLEQRGFWGTSLLLITSAALGGIAVAIWNRRTLAQMRQQIHPDNQP